MLPSIKSLYDAGVAVRTDASRVLLAGIVAGCMATWAFAREAQPDRLTLVQKLIYESSAARQLSESQDEQARELYDAAIRIYEKALAAYESGDEPKMNEHLNEASRKMFEATRFSGHGVFSDSKKRADFDTRLKSIEVLAEAYKRISTEKGVDPSSGVEAIRAHTENAQSLLVQGQLDEARTALDEGYLVAKTSIERLRGGDTLVRTLEFASEEEEYAYELDRNDTHKMLLSVLGGTQEATQMQSMSKNFVEEAAALRAEAESQAESGEYERAIKTLEDSTRNLIRAIRAAGIYIPG